MLLVFKMLAWFTGRAMKRHACIFWIFYVTSICNKSRIKYKCTSIQCRAETANAYDRCFYSNQGYLSDYYKKKRPSWIKCFDSSMIFPSLTWWYSDRMLCISSTSSLEISFPTNVRSYDVISSPTHTPSSFLMGGLRARETCWWEYDKSTSSCTNTSTQRLLISF